MEYQARGSESSLECRQLFSYSIIFFFSRGTHNEHCRIRWPQSRSVSAQYTLWHLTCFAPVLTLCSQIYCKWCHLVRISDSYVFISYNAERHTRVGSILTSGTEGEEFNSRPEYWLSCLKLFLFPPPGPSGAGLSHIKRLLIHPFRFIIHW